MTAWTRALVRLIGYMVALAFSAACTVLVLFLIVVFLFGGGLNA